MNCQTDTSSCFLDSISLYMGKVDLLRDLATSFFLLFEAVVEFFKSRVMRWDLFQGCRAIQHDSLTVLMPIPRF